MEKARFHKAKISMQGLKAAAIAVKMQCPNGNGAVGSPTFWLQSRRADNGGAEAWKPSAFSKNNSDNVWTQQLRRGLAKIPCLLAKAAGEF